MNLQLALQKVCKCMLAVLFMVTPFLSNLNAQETVVQRVRLDFTAPDGAVRQILLGFTSDNSATDGFDYGWDAINWDNFANDMNWIIGDTRCIIQGVGSFNNSKTYPLGVFLGETGSVKISLNSLENFEEDIPVYIHDTLLDTYTQINEEDYENILDQGEYEDRFYIAFNAPLNSNLVLSTDEFKTAAPTIRYANNTNEILVDTQGTSQIKSLRIYDISGKQIYQELLPNASEIKTYFKTKSKGNYIVSVNTDKGVFSKILLL